MKRIGILDVDCHGAKKKCGAMVYPNIALAKIARYYRSKGCTVEWAIPMEHYDTIYMSKIFNFTPDDTYIYNADRIIRGGTGYDIHSVLPAYIDMVQPDYSIYPSVPKDTAYGFLTRGCCNRCRWCVVPKKEGQLHPYMDIEQIAIEGRKNIVLMDNNILAAYDYARYQFDKIIQHGYRVDFNQAMDARLMSDEYAWQMSRMKWIHNRIRFGCYTDAQIQHVENAIELLVKHGFRGEIFLYTMIGGNGGGYDDFKESYNRISYWQEKLFRYREGREGLAVYAYAQPYRDPFNVNNIIPQWCKDMANWTNKRQLFTTVLFEDFSPRKGFYCRSYFN